MKSPLGQPLLDALQRICCGGVLLDAAGNVLHINEVGRQILAEVVCGRPAGTTDLDRARDAVKALLRSASKRLRVGGDTWIVIERTTIRQLVLHAVQVSNGLRDEPHTVVILVDLQKSPRPNAQTLQDIFGLTPAEATLAVQIAAGGSLAVIASTNKVKIATARSQLASIFAKTHTRRQAELVALLARVAVLP
jgi:DNA-binding CsgD family transcriptional regulator